MAFCEPRRPTPVFAIDVAGWIGVTPKMLENGGLPSRWTGEAGFPMIDDQTAPPRRSDVTGRARAG